MASDSSQSSSDNDNIATGTTNVVSNVPISEDEQDKMFNFTEAKVHLDRIIRDWSTEVEDTEVRRKTRKLELDIEGLRQKGELDEDETIVPIRVIDSNIMREQPPYINYLKNSRRIAIFECVSDPEQDSDLIEQEFTKKSTYTKWETPHYKCLDGSQAHGWDAVEVVYDESKPGHFAIEQIGHDRLLFPRSAIDIQQCPRIIRCYDVTILQLQKWVKSYGFNQEQVDNLRKTRKNTQKENETVRIYKLYFKKDGIVFVSWFCTTDGCTDWLKAPVQFYCGVDEKQTTMSIDLMTGMPTPQESWQNKPMELYPILILPYRETEESKVVDHKGRCFLDEFKQEAQTALWSAFINGMNRASTVFASPMQEDGSGSALKELSNVKLVGNRILSRPMQFWHMDYPDPIVLRTLQHAEVTNSEETNQVNFAAMNREDSRKTAKEIGAAQQQQSLLNSVQLTLFSTFIREVYSYAWMIVQSQALQSKIKFLQVKKQMPVLDPMFNKPVIDQMTGAPKMQDYYENDFETIGKIYSIRAAGDVDVIQKEELVARMQQDWPVIQGTPLAQQFLLDYIKLKYPERAEKYAGLMEQGDPSKQLIAQLATVLQGAVKDIPQQNLSPEEVNTVQQILARAQAYLNPQQVQQQNTQQ